MGQELLDVNGYKRTPRVYYLAETKEGIKSLRGSWRDMYSHAVVWVDTSPTIEVQSKDLEHYATFHSTKELAQTEYKRRTKNYSESQHEVVELKKIEAKEYRRLKTFFQKSHGKESKARLEKYNQQVRQALLEKGGNTNGN